MLRDRPLLPRLVRRAWSQLRRSIGYFDIVLRDDRARRAAQSEQCDPHSSPIAEPLTTDKGEQKARGSAQVRLASNSVGRVAPGRRLDLELVADSHAKDAPRQISSNLRT